MKIIPSLYLLLPVLLLLSACSDEESVSVNYVPENDFYEVVSRIELLEKGYAESNAAFSKNITAIEARLTDLKGSLKLLSKSTQTLSQNHLEHVASINAIQQQLAASADELAKVKVTANATVKARKAALKKTYVPAFPFVARGINQVGPITYLSYNKKGSATLEMVRVGELIGAGWIVVSVDQMSRKAFFRHQNGKKIERIFG